MRHSADGRRYIYILTRQQPAVPVSTGPEVECTLRSSALCTVCTQRRAPEGIEGQLGPHGQGVATLMVDDAQRAHVGRGVLLASTRNRGISNCKPVR